MSRRTWCFTGGLPRGSGIEVQRGFFARFWFFSVRSGIGRGKREGGMGRDWETMGEGGIVYSDDEPEDL